MKKDYAVSIYYEGGITVCVSAESEEQAEELARNKFYRKEYDEAIANNAQIADTEAEEC